MEYHGVWRRTVLYEPKDILSDNCEQADSMMVLWMQSKILPEGYFVDLRIPLSASTNALSDLLKSKKSFCGTTKYDLATKELVWNRMMDFRSIPTGDVGLMSVLSYETVNSNDDSTIQISQIIQEDGVLPGDDYREIWERWVANPAYKTANALMQRGVDNSILVSDVTCLLKDKITGDIKGFFLIVDGYFGVTINMRLITPTEVESDLVSLTSLKTYFGSANTILSEACRNEIELFLSQYITVMGDASNMIILYAIDNDMVGHTIFEPISMPPLSSESSVKSIVDIMRNFDLVVVDGMLPKGF